MEPPPGRGCGAAGAAAGRRRRRRRRRERRRRWRRRRPAAAPAALARGGARRRRRWPVVVVVVDAGLVAGELRVGHHRVAISSSTSFSWSSAMRWNVPHSASLHWNWRGLLRPPAAPSGLLLRGLRPRASPLCRWSRRPGNPSPACCRPQFSRPPARRRARPSCSSAITAVMRASGACEPSAWTSAGRAGCAQLLDQLHQQIVDVDLLVGGAGRERVERRARSPRPSTSRSPTRTRGSAPAPPCRTR